MQGSDGEAGIDGGDVEADDRRKVPDPQLPHPDIVAARDIDHTPVSVLVSVVRGGSRRGRAAPTTQ